MKLTLSSSSHLLYVCLTGSVLGLITGQTTVSSNNSTFGPRDLTLIGPDSVTVGIPVSYVCLSACSPGCRYIMTVGNQSVTGQELVFTVREPLRSTLVTCTAQNITGRTSRTNRTLQLLQGPQNVTLSGPEFLRVGQSERFRCSAVCWPSCNFTWLTNGIVASDSGNEALIAPSPEDTAETIVCTATNSLSGLFASTVLKLFVTDGPLYTDIVGPDAVSVGSAVSYKCLSVCKPSCNYTWTINGETLHGRTIEVTVKHREGPMLLTCTVTNTITRATTVITKILRLTGTGSTASGLHQISHILIFLTSLALLIAL